MSVIPTQRPAAPAPALQRSTCQSCGSARLTVLAMTLTDGTPVTFASCHDCEHRNWSHDGSQLAIADVLKRATKIKA
jgi:DNA-directed RNA polymerase subunit M/transcription elongation factor TFIIS